MQNQTSLEDSQKIKITARKFYFLKLVQALSVSPSLFKGRNQREDGKMQQTCRWGTKMASFFLSLFLPLFLCVYVSLSLHSLRLRGSDSAEGGVMKTASSSSPRLTTERNRCCSCTHLLQLKKTQRRTVKKMTEEEGSYRLWLSLRVQSELCSTSPPTQWPHGSLVPTL